MAEFRDRALADQYADIDAERIAERDPQRRHTEAVGESRQTEEGGTARSRRCKRERQQKWAVATSGGGEVVRALDSAAAEIAESQHRSDVEHQKDPGPGI